jgi:hypothetical protein
MVAMKLAEAEHAETYQQNRQAAKTTPVVASRPRAIRVSFIVRLHWGANCKPSGPYLPATTRDYTTEVRYPGAVWAIGHCASVGHPLVRTSSEADLIRLGLILWAMMAGTARCATAHIRKIRKLFFTCASRPGPARPRAAGC